MQMSMFSLEERPVSRSPSQAFEKEWLTPEAISPSPILPLLINIGPSGWSGKTSPASCHQAKDGTLVPSSGAWQNSGMGSPTECLTLSTCEWTGLDGLSLNDEGVCSLSEILETGDVPPQYYLSAKACRGILRRADKRGKELPQQLARALQVVAGSEQISIAMAD